MTAPRAYLSGLRLNVKMSALPTYYDPNALLFRTSCDAKDMLLGDIYSGYRYAHADSAWSQMTSVPAVTPYSNYGYQSTSPPTVQNSTYTNASENYFCYDNYQESVISSGFVSNEEKAIADDVIECFLREEYDQGSNRDGCTIPPTDASADLFPDTNSPCRSPTAQLLCPFYPSEPTRLARKKSSKRRQRPTKTHTCGLCLAVLASRTEYSLHIKTTHKQALYSCDICHKDFKQLTTMRTHRRKHTGERPYTCQTCERTFSDHSSFIKHKRIHSNDRPYKCGYCDKTFIQSGNCKRHMRSMHGYKQ